MGKNLEVSSNLRLMMYCRSYVSPVAAVRAIFQTLESIEPESAVNYASLQSEIWEAFEHSIFDEYLSPDYLTESKKRMVGAIREEWKNNLSIGTADNRQHLVSGNKKVLGSAFENVLFAKTNGSRVGRGYRWQAKSWKDEGVEPLTKSVPLLQTKLAVRVKHADGNAQAPSASLSQCEACLVDTTVDQPLYHELPSSEWFRLIVIERGVFEDPIKCHLKCYLRSDMHSQYETLSYSWHNNEWNDFTTEQKKLYEPWEIICNGKNVTVQPNLWRALQRLRHRDRSRTVWADALCIDQSNDRERAQQVQIMSLIYSNALQTVIWMGESKQASVEKSLDLICRIVNSWDERHPAEYWMTDDATSETLARRPTGPVAKEDDENFALSDLFRLSWFRRKWVIQEAVLSRSCEIIWQNCSISWYWVGLAAAIIRNQNIENLFISEPSNTGICNAYLIFRLSSHEGLPSVQLTFLQLLRLTATFQATDPRDSIFALLGIQTKDHHPQNSPLFLADYTLDTETLFRKVAEKFMDHPEPLKFLVNTESWTKTGATRNKEYITDSKPSWVPIWGKNAGFMLAPWSLQDGFHPARGLDFQRQITEDTSHLVVRGIGITTVLCREDENLRDSVWDLLTCGMFKVVSLEILELFSRTLTCGRNAYGGREREVHALLSHFAAFLCANKDTSIDKIETSKANEHLDISVLNALAKDGDAKAFEAVASNVCQNSRLFLTVSGHIGLGPRQIGSGDVICVLGGADMPFALRRQDGCYTLVGDCYIDDVMEGQAVEAMKMKCSHHGAFDIEKVIDSRLASEWIPEQVRPQVELVRDDLVAAAAKKYSVLQESWIEIC